MKDTMYMIMMILGAVSMILGCVLGAFNIVWLFLAVLGLICMGFSEVKYAFSDEKLWM